MKTPLYPPHAFQQRFVDQPVAIPMHSLFIEQCFILRIPFGTDARQWKESRTSKTILLQEANHLLRCTFILCYDILDISAQSRLDRCLVLHLSAQILPSFRLFAV